jgi:hypothetical protein
MKKSLKFVLLAVALLLIPAAHAQSISVTGSLKDLGYNNATAPNTYVQMTLENYGSAIPSVGTSGVFVSPNPPAFLPNGSGVISGTIVPNDVISPANTYYQVCVFYQGISQWCRNYSIASTPNPWNLNSASPLNPAPAGVAAPNVVLQNPATTQNILQPPGTSLEVNGVPVGSGGGSYAAADATLFVSTAGNDANPGTSPGTLAKATPNGGLSAMPSGGGTIYVGCGTYSFSSSLAFTKRVNIIGQGNCTVLQFTGTGAAIDLTSLPQPNVVGSVLQNLQLLGPGTGTSTTGLSIGGATTDPIITFDHIEVTGFGTGVGFANHSGFVTFKDSSIYANGTNVSAAASTIAEAINFENTLINSASTWADGIVVANASSGDGGTMRFKGTHVDFNQAQFGSGWVISFTGTPYFEDSSAFEGASNPKIANNGAVLYIEGASTFYSGSGNTPNFISASSGGSGQEIISGGKFYSNATTAGYLVSTSTDVVNINPTPTIIGYSAESNECGGASLFAGSVYCSPSTLGSGQGPWLYGVQGTLIAGLNNDGSITAAGWKSAGSTFYNIFSTAAETANRTTTIPDANTRLMPASGTAYLPDLNINMAGLSLLNVGGITFQTVAPIIWSAPEGACTGAQIGQDGFCIGNSSVHRILEYDNGGAFYLPTSAGQITLSSGSGSHTFTISYPSAPICVAKDVTTTGNTVTMTVTAGSISLSGTGSDVINWICSIGSN